MKTYTPLNALALASRCYYASRCEFGWLARRTAKRATHELHYTVCGGQLMADVVAVKVAK